MKFISASVLLLLSSTVHSKEVVFRSQSLSQEKYEKLIFERNAVSPFQYFSESIKNKEVNYSPLDACLKKTEKQPSCENELLSFLEKPLNAEERENLKAILQDLLSIKKLKKAFVYSQSLLHSLNERKRSQPIFSLRGQGAISMIAKSKSLQDVQILRNGVLIKKENLFWYEDTFTQWTLLFSTQPPRVFTGYLKQLFDVIEKELNSPKKSCEELKALFSHPDLPPQFEVVGLSDCEVKRDLFEVSHFDQKLSTGIHFNSGNLRLVYFAGGLITTLVLLEYLKDKKIVISSSF